MYLNGQDTEEKPRYAGRTVVGRRVCEAFGMEERRGDGEVESSLGKTPSSLNPLRLLNSPVALDNPLSALFFFSF